MRREPRTWGLLGAALLLVALGLLTLSSISSDLALRQGLYVGVGLGVFAWFRALHPSLRHRIFLAGYLLHLVLLGVVLTVGAGAVHRWIPLGPLHYQPSEGMKLFLLPLVVSAVEQRRLSGLLQAGLWTAVPFVLILMEPDLATAGVLGLAVMGVAFLAGYDGRLFLPLVFFPFLALTLWVPVLFWVVLILGVIGILRFRYGLAYLLTFSLIATLAGLLTPLLWNRVLKPYQRDRIVQFLGHQRDPLGSEWQTRQAEIALGSGGILGKGYGRGTQKNLQFLPAAHTDFVLSSFAEEWGFVGVTLFLLLSFTLVGLLWLAAEDCPLPGDQLLLRGTALLFALHFLLNTGMNLRMFPVAGLPMPLMTYGGSHLLWEFGLLGVASRIWQDRRVQ